MHEKEQELGADKIQYSWATNSILIIVGICALLLQFTSKVEVELFCWFGGFFILIGVLRYIEGRGKTKDRIAKEREIAGIQTALKAKLDEIEHHRNLVRT